MLLMNLGLQWKCISSEVTCIVLKASIADPSTTSITAIPLIFGMSAFPDILEYNEGWEHSYVNCRKKEDNEKDIKRDRQTDRERGRESTLQLQHRPCCVLAAPEEVFHDRLGVKSPKALLRHLTSIPLYHLVILSPRIYALMIFLHFTRIADNIPASNYPLNHTE